MTPELDFFNSEPEEGAQVIDLRHQAFTVTMHHAESVRGEGLQTREQFAAFDVINHDKPKGKKARFELVAFAIQLPGQVQ